MADEAAELAINSLSLQMRFPPDPLRQHGGFWFPGYIVRGMEAVRHLARLLPQVRHHLALAFATAHRAEHPPGCPSHPLRHRNPHDCVKFLEFDFAESPDGGGDLFAPLRSPRVLGTHLPYSILPERVTAEGGPGGRIVYICRDPKDTLVSMWQFAKKCMAAASGKEEPSDAFKIEEAFELFCDGQCADGPMWHHVAGYWEASRRRPDKVLFLRYEEVLGDPVGNVRKLAEFMGRAFSRDEEAARVVQHIVELCSFDVLKNMEVNQSGIMVKYDLKNESFFRKGVAGDWSNHMTPAMAARLDKIVEDALHGSGFTFCPVSDGDGA